MGIEEFRDNDDVFDDFDDLTTASALTCSSPSTVDFEQEKNEDESSQKESPVQNPSSVIQLPPIVKSDMRRTFARIYMSMINGGDFRQVQDFSQSFIRPDAVFGARIRASSAYQLPSFLHGWGPRAHVHYMIGIYVMYPDVAVTYGDTKLITSNQFTGTKVIIPWQCQMTKTYHIPVECWIPTAEAAEKMYVEPSIDRMMSTLSLQDTVSEQSDSTSLKKTTKKRKQPSVTALALRNQSKPVPMQFVQNLQQSAARFPPTAQLLAEGTYTITLDESHHITSISLEVTQVGMTSKVRASK